MRTFLAIIFGCISAGAVWAQDGTSKQYGDWTLRCSAQQNGAKVCSLRQRVLAGEGQDMLAEVSLNLARLDGQARVLLVMNSPEGVALNVAPGFVVDGKGFGAAGEAVNLSWRTCIRQLCRAAAILSPEQQGAVMAGNVMTMGYRRFQEGKTTAFPISLKGVTAGLAALSSQ